MALENKLGINDSAELARAEERISKTKAVRLYESKIAEDFLDLRKFINFYLTRYMTLPAG